MHTPLAFLFQRSALWISNIWEVRRTCFLSFISWRVSVWVFISVVRTCMFGSTLRSHRLTSRAGGSFPSHTCFSVLFDVKEWSRLVPIAFKSSGSNFPLVRRICFFSANSWRFGVLAGVSIGTIEIIFGWLYFSGCCSSFRRVAATFMAAKVIGHRNLEYNQPSRDTNTGYCSISMRGRECYNERSCMYSEIAVRESLDANYHLREDSL